MSNIDLSIIDNLFREEKEEKFILSEETIQTLKKWELWKESDQLAKLQRMIHTAPAGERNALRKAIAELEKREASKQRKTVKKIGSYVVYENWAKEIKPEGPSLTPDYWYNREASKMGDRGVRTFLYNTYADYVYMYDVSGYRYMHSKFIEDLLHENDLQHGDIDPEILQKWRKKYGNDNLFDILTDEELQEKDHFVHGRTGPYPLYEDKGEMDFYAAIWTRVKNKNILDSIMKQLNKRLKPAIKKDLTGIIMP